jgi:hypothetical protein
MPEKERVGEKQSKILITFKIRHKVIRGNKEDKK